MPGTNRNLSLMLLPQSWDGHQLIANLLLLPNGQILFTDDISTDVEIYAHQLERTSNTMTRLIAAHTGQKEDTVRSDSQRNRWFSAEEARDYGIIDHIVERLDDVRPTFSKTAGL